MTAVLLKVLEFLATGASLVKDGAAAIRLIPRRQEQLPVAGWLDGDRRLRGIKVLIDDVELRVSADGGSIHVDLRLVNTTRRRVVLDQVRVDFLRMNSYGLLETAVFVPATGSAEPRSFGLGRFEFTFPAARVAQIRSGLKVSSNRQSAPPCDIEGRAEFHFRAKNREVRTESNLTMRNVNVQIRGIGPDGAL